MQTLADRWETVTPGTAFHIKGTPGVFLRITPSDHTPGQDVIDLDDGSRHSLAELALWSDPADALEVRQLITAP